MYYALRIGDAETSPVIAMSLLEENKKTASTPIPSLCDRHPVRKARREQKRLSAQADKTRAGTAVDSI